MSSTAFSQTIIERQSEAAPPPPIGLFLPGLLGAFFACILLGLVINLGHQAIFSFPDKLWIRLWVAFIVVAQCVETSVDIYNVCNTLVFNFGDVGFVQRFSPTVVIPPLIGDILIPQAQLYLLWKAWVFSRFTKLQKYYIIHILMGSLFIFILFCTAAGLAGPINFFKHGFTSGGIFQSLGASWQYGNLLIDLFLALFLSWEIFTTKKVVNVGSGLAVDSARSREPVLHLLNRLVFLLIASGALCLGTQSLAVGLWAREKRRKSRFERWSALPFAIISKVYTISLLVILSASKVKKGPGETSSSYGAEKPIPSARPPTRVTSSRGVQVHTTTTVLLDQTDRYSKEEHNYGFGSGISNHLDVKGFPNLERHTSDNSHFHVSASSLQDSIPPTPTTGTPILPQEIPFNSHHRHPLSVDLTKTAMKRSWTNTNE